MTQPVRTTVGQLLASDVGLIVEVQCPGKPRGEYRGAAPAGDDQGSIAVRLRDDRGTRTVGAMDVTPVLVHRPLHPGDVVAGVDGGIRVVR